MQSPTDSCLQRLALVPFQILQELNHLHLRFEPHEANGPKRVCIDFINGLTAFGDYVLVDQRYDFTALTVFDKASHNHGP